MPIEQLLVLVGVAVLALLAMSVALGAAWLAGRRGVEAELAAGTGGVPGVTPSLRAAMPAGPLRAPARDGGSARDVAGPAVVTVDRVVRVVALLFMAAAGVVVATSGNYADTDVAIYLLLAAGTLFVVFMQDLLPERVAVPARYWVEAGGAIAFLTVLVGLSGGLTSPFFLGYFLLVGGGSLAAGGTASLVLASASAAAYAIIGLLVAGSRHIDGSDVAWIGFNLVALALLAYVATVAGREQRRARDAALQLSRFDPLTGLFNRAAFFASMEREIRRVERMGRGFCVLMLDLDDLKPVNDTFGHPAGDQLLRAITEVVLRTVRATDTSGRYGGDEFVVLLPETDADGAFVVAEKLRRDISALSVRVDERSLRTSVSIGLVAYPEDGLSIESLLSAVDAAMYEAKRRGKNQIVGYTTRTERIPTAIGPERAAVVRPRSPRVDESRAAEVGVPIRGAPSPWWSSSPAVPEAPMAADAETRAPAPPAGEVPVGVGSRVESAAPAPPRTPAPRQGSFSPVPPAVGPEDDADDSAPVISPTMPRPDAAWPRIPSMPSSGPPTGVAPASAPARGAPSVPPLGPPAPAAPPSAPARTVPPSPLAPTAPTPDPSAISIARPPSAPGAPGDPAAERPSVTAPSDVAHGPTPSSTPAPAAAPGRPAAGRPVRPSGPAGTRPPVPPPGTMPWNTPSSGEPPPDNAPAPAERPYVVLPIEPDDPAH